jgi:hypothetical protein
VGLDDPGVNHVQRTEMLLGPGATDGIVVPVALRDECTRRADR